MEDELADEFDKALPKSQLASGCSDDECDAADRIVELCDWIAYDFCLERPARRAIAVRPSVGALPVEITYVLDGLGRISIDPWPLAASPIEDFVVGYEAADYPNPASVTIVPFRVLRADYNAATSTQ